MGARSGLLAALSVLMLSVALGSRAAYWHASYMLAVERPGLTVLVLGSLAIGLVASSRAFPPAYERLAVIGARTAVLMVNAAFLVGSLFGDRLWGWPSSAFTVAWAILLVIVGAWGISSGWRWVVNAAAVFGALHFYTQWFEFLGPQPAAILVGGILLIAFGLSIARFNRWLGVRVAGAM